MGSRTSLGAPPANSDRLLLVGPASRRQVERQHLAARGFRLVETANFASAERALEDSQFDLVVMEAGLDRRRLAEQCRRLAIAPRGLIVIHPPTDPALAIEALEAGADDCLPSICNPRELAARVRSVLRRHRRRPPQERGRFVQFDDFNLDLLGRQLFTHEGRSLPITDTQFRLLCALVDRPREVIPRQQLQDLVQGEESDFFDRTIDCQVSRLRRRLAQVSVAEIISTHRGVGYRLNARVRR
jgi:two-component system OmpR family response regulator